MNKDLTATQNDYALFLPATSSFYGSFIGYQRHRYPYVTPNRIPQNFVNDVESLNYLDPNNGLFYYKWCLYSAGHANLDLSKNDDRESLFRNRKRDGSSWVLGDSGGFQIGKGVWAGEWRDPTGPEVQAKMAECIAKGIELVPQLDAAGNIKLDKNGNTKTTKVDHVKLYQAQLDASQKKREQVLAWMDALMDYGMVLDIPSWIARSPAGAAATNITSYELAVEATKYNNEYFIKNRNGNCKFLNVLQGENHTQADDWYQKMKDFCDPTIYGDKAFNGWAMGGQNMCDVHLVLKRLVALKFDGLLEKGKQDWMHFLGTSKLEWALLLTDIQRAIRKYHNENFTMSFDCASPFLATANGQIYVHNETEDRKKWHYRMMPSIDNKKYATDTRLFKDTVVNDGWFKNFTSSPIIDGVKTNEICVYAPGNLNRMGKENKTSWDSFTYAIMMGHNVWMHLSAVQEANQQYDNGLCPAMLVDEKFERIYVRDLIDAIFSTPDRAVAESIIEDYSKLWMAIPGTRGAIGKKTVNASTNYFELFDEVEPSVVSSHEDGEFSEEEINKLEKLENNTETGNDII
jgi:hypothetical protein